MSTEIRRMPKKTIIYLIIMILLSFVAFYIATTGKSTKATRILGELGYKNVTNVKVYATHQFLREDTNIKGFKDTISFTNLDTNEECKGFILKDFKRNVEEDLICKKIGK